MELAVNQNLLIRHGCGWWCTKIHRPICCRPV